MKEFTHFDKYGNAVMVDVSHKEETVRVAMASGLVRLSESTFQALKSNQVGKGDVLGVARIAGIMAAKKTASIIPLCHPLALSQVKIDFKLLDSSVHIFAKVKTTGPTGVEMEALTAVSTAALTIYDMCKAMDKSILIEKIHLQHKSGGKSGVFNYEG